MLPQQGFLGCSTLGVFQAAARRSGWLQSASSVARCLAMTSCGTMGVPEYSRRQGGQQQGLCVGRGQAEGACGR